MPAEAKIEAAEHATAAPLMPVLPGSELNLGALLDVLARHAALPLVFAYDDRDIRAGYHVTEVKSGHFDSLDCGANPESWGETFIQLWDIEEIGKSHMKTGKFAAIMGKVETSLGLDRQNKLTFEVSDGIRPMQLFAATTIEIANSAIRVSLLPRAASCKPRDRWLEAPLAENALQMSQGCCGGSAPKSGHKACCG